MNDDEVLDVMRQTVAPARLDRPVAEILRRGRARRRNRTLLGVAGGGLAAVAAVAIALPTAGRPATDVPTGRAAAPPARSETSAPVRMVPAGWSLSRSPDDKVKLTFDAAEILDPEGLQRALSGAGIPAVVKTRVLCTPKYGELPQAGAVYRSEVKPPDYQYTFTITPTKMPAGGRLYFSLFHPRGGERLAKVAAYLVSDDDPMSCKQM